ncbi:MAG: DUF58 domain-containing protein [Methylovulum sp.]|nr:DUF58 domain-containing protein [Methylovulum sp.]
MLSSKTTTPANADERIAVPLKALIDLAKPAASLTLHHQQFRAQQGGAYLSRFKGRGMEFDETRLYQPGDDIRSIDWRVTARTGKPHTKIFREERERPVFISVDNRATMHFATRGVFKSVLAAKLAGLLAWAAQHHGDRIGGQLFSERDCTELKPQNGRHAVLRFLNALVNPAHAGINPLVSIHSPPLEKGGLGGIFQNIPSNQAQQIPPLCKGGSEWIHPLALELMLARLTQHAHPGSLIYIISDFRGLNDKAETHLAKLSQHCDVVLIFVYDPLESHLPAKGRFRFTDDERDVVIDSGDTQRILKYQQRFVERQQRLEQLAKKRGLAFIQCSTTDNPIQSLT